MCQQLSRPVKTLVFVGITTYAYMQIVYTSSIPESPL